MYTKTSNLQYICTSLLFLNNNLQRLSQIQTSYVSQLVISPWAVTFQLHKTAEDVTNQKWHFMYKQDKAAVIIISQCKDFGKHPP